MTDRKLPVLTAAEGEFCSVKMDSYGRIMGVIQIGQFTLKTVDDRTISITRECGEGMGVLTSDIEKILDDYYSENF